VRWRWGLVGQLCDQHHRSTAPHYVLSVTCSCTECIHRNDSIGIAFFDSGCTDRLIESHSEQTNSFSRDCGCVHITLVDMFSWRSQSSLICNRHDCSQAQNISIVGRYYQFHKQHSRFTQSHSDALPCASQYPIHSHLPPGSRPTTASWPHPKHPRYRNTQSDRE